MFAAFFWLSLLVLAACSAPRAEASPCAPSWNNALGLTLVGGAESSFANGGRELCTVYFDNFYQTTFGKKVVNVCSAHNHADHVNIIVGNWIRDGLGFDNPQQKVCRAPLCGEQVQ